MGEKINNDKDRLVLINYILTQWTPTEDYSNFRTAIRSILKQIIDKDANEKAIKAAKEQARKVANANAKAIMLIKNFTDIIKGQTKIHAKVTLQEFKEKYETAYQGMEEKPGETMEQIFNRGRTRQLP